MASVMGVNGLIPQSALGFVLPHEHLFTDISCYCQLVPSGPGEEAFFRQKVSLLNRQQVLDNPWGIEDNTKIDDLQNAVEETQSFAALGGATIFDMSPCTAMGRNSQGLLQVAQQSGVQVVMSSGRYTLTSMTEWEKTLSVADLESIIANEFLYGIEGIYPGLIKVGFVSKIDVEAEVRSLRAAARVQHRVGCALAVHPYIWEPISHQILDILEKEGCDLQRVILCHQDYVGDQIDYLDSLVRRGAYIEFDTFGSGWINDPMWQKTDAEKIGFLKKQVILGNVDHLLISGDMCLKVMFTRWGGAGYTHLPKAVIPAMLAIGINPELVHTITEENPARVFCH